MPEGDTVWRTARQLDRALSGQVLLESDIRVPAFATVDLTGSRVVETVARGKHLLSRIGDGAEHGSPAVTLHTHLKMEGSWHLYRGGSRWRRPAHQARVVLRTADWTAVGFALGVTEVIDRSEELAVMGHLGPDLLGADWDEDEAVLRLGSRPDRPLGEALLDQRNLAGIGNLYKAETLFLAGVSPFREASNVGDLTAVVRIARRLLMANRENPIQSTTGITRRGEQHWVYLRAGRPCRRCGSPIQSAEQGQPSRERLTLWCAHCQPSTSGAPGQDSIHSPVR